MEHRADPVNTLSPAGPTPVGVPGTPEISGDGRPRVGRWLPLAVPTAYFLVALALQPAGEFGPPPAFPDARRVVYDDFDHVALALRGLNADLGRAPGRATEPRLLLDDEEYSETLTADRPLAATYFLEYPHLMLLVFRLPYLAGVSAPDPPTGLLDGSHVDAGFHTPRNDREEKVWAGLRAATRVYAAVMTVCLTLLMVTIGIGYRADGSLGGPCWMLMLPSALYFSLWRFDVMPALLVALALAALGRSRAGVAGFALGLATMVKVYPVLLLPLLLRWLLPEPRAAIKCLFLYAATCAAVLVPVVWLYGIDGALGPYRFQLGRPPEFGWTLYGIVFDRWLAAQTGAPPLIRVGCVILTVVAVCRSRPDGLDGVLRRAAVILLVFVNLQVFFSPQWLIWLTPFLLPLAAKSPLVFRLAVALDLVTYVAFPLCMDQMLPGGSLRERLVFARMWLMLGLAVALMAQEYRWSWPRPLWAAGGPCRPG